MKNVRKNKIVVIAMMAVFIGAIFATALSASVLSTSPVRVMPLAFSTTPSTTMKLNNATPVANGWNTTAVKVNLSATVAQDAEAIRGMWYAIDTWNMNGSVWTAGSWTKYNATPAGFMLTQNGSYKIRFNATDAGWDNETTNSTIVNLDLVNPTHVVSTPSTSWSIIPYVHVNVTGVNDTAKWWINSSGANKTVYTIGSAAAVTKYYQNESTAAAGVSINVTTQGVNVVNITSYDKAGNTVKATNLSVKIDSVAPTTTAANAAVTVAYYTFTAADASSGVATVVVNGTTVTAVAGVYNVSVTDGENTLVINITDVAGNVMSKTVTINATIAAENTTDYTMYIIIIVVIVVVVVVVAVLMMRKGKGKAAEAPAAEEKS